mgnify:CR=1 FL=1
MKGIVFTEFLELVEDKFGLEMVDKIILNSQLDSGGIYTSIGTYSFTEMLQLLQNLNKETGIEIDTLLEVYAEHFFGVIETSYPHMLRSYKDPIEMLASIENHIHVEVKKIYHDAELPTFEVIDQTKQHLIMLYKSSRAMHHFGLGLMKKTFSYFGESATIELEKIQADGTEVKFSIFKNNESK